PLSIPCRPSPVGRLPGLLPFPTRRSSDLQTTALLQGPQHRAFPIGELQLLVRALQGSVVLPVDHLHVSLGQQSVGDRRHLAALADRQSTRLNSSHVSISYAVFCLKTNRRD